MKSRRDICSKDLWFESLENSELSYKSLFFIHDEIIQRVKELVMLMLPVLCQ